MEGTVVKGVYEILISEILGIEVLYMKGDSISGLLRVQRFSPLS
jgi:hypothetical protein